MGWEMTAYLTDIVVSFFWGGMRCFYTCHASSHLYRRNGGIRTRDPLLPKQVRYQAAPHSVKRMQYLMKRMILHHSATSCSQCIGSIHDWLKRGYVGDAVLLSIIVVELDQQKPTHKRPMAQLLVLGVLPRTRSPDHGVRRIRLIRAAGAKS